MKKTIHFLLGGCALASVLALGILSEFSEAEAEGLFPCAPKARVEKIRANAPVYEIAEPDLLQAFYAEVAKMRASGEYDARLAESKDRIRSQMENPTGADLPKAEEIRRWALEAAVPETLPEALLLDAAKVEAPRISRPLLFVDGTDPESLKAVEAAKRAFGDFRVVLTAGSVAQMSKAANLRIFFDQGGALVMTFGIKAVPAVLFNGAEFPEGMEFPAEEAEGILSRIASSSV